MFPGKAEEEGKKFDRERHNSFQMSRFETTIYIYNCKVEIVQVLSGEQSVPGRRQEQVNQAF